MKNEIALVLCVYINDTREQFEEMFNSLEEQTLKEFDIFVQQDGQINKELDNYLKEKHQCGKIKYMGKRDNNRGFAYSLNEIIKYILDLNLYRYIARMDSDDICVNNRIEIQYQFLNSHPNIDVCGGWIEEFNTDDDSIQIIQYPKDNNSIIKHLKKRNPIAHVTTFFRVEFFYKVGFYDSSKLNEDFDLWIRALDENMQFYNIQAVLVRVRTNNAFFNRRKNINRAFEVMKLKFKSTKLFNFGIIGYIYAVFHFILFMSPGWFKYIIYKNLRK